MAALRHQPRSRLLRRRPGHLGRRPTRTRSTRCAKNTIFTNVALTADGDVWWEGMTEAPPAGSPTGAASPWTPAMGEARAHPNARFACPAGQCPVIAPEWENPAGVPISAILFGGRRASPCRWSPRRSTGTRRVHGPTVASEGTAAAENKVGELRRDPFAMLPFCGYNMATTSPLAEDRPLKAPSCRRSSSSTGSARTRRQVHLAGLRREQPRAQVDLRPGKPETRPILHPKPGDSPKNLSTEDAITHAEQGPPKISI
jgi:hypothetical protein